MLSREYPGGFLRFSPKEAADRLGRSMGISLMVIKVVKRKK
jgi:hypothetical protein